MKKGIFIVFLVCFQSSFSQVGIGTTDPQQTLHIASSTGTIRVESLNSTNNSFNGGGSVNYPLYVDENGDFTLELKTLINTEDIDALNDTTLPTSTVTLLETDDNGIEKTEITNYSITVSRASLLEVKYNLSFDVYADPSKAKITDNLARRITTFLRINGQTRNYGPASKCYSSGSSNSVTGTMYNSKTAYISIPAAGTYTISLWGNVSSGVKAGGGPGSPSISTYVEFATGNDMVFFRLH